MKTSSMNIYFIWELLNLLPSKHRPMNFCIRWCEWKLFSQQTLFNAHNHKVQWREFEFNYNFYLHYLDRLLKFTLDKLVQISDNSFLYRLFLQFSNFLSVLLDPSDFWMDIWIFLSWASSLSSFCHDDSLRLSIQIFRLFNNQIQAFLASCKTRIAKLLFKTSKYFPNWKPNRNYSKWIVWQENYLKCKLLLQ